jgi:apolipoprotein N-acyltransferase
MIVLVIWLLPVAVSLPSAVQYQPQPVKVALLQGNIPQYRKWQPEMRQPTLDWYRQVTETHWNRDLVVWPETAIPAYEDEVVEYIDTLHRLAQLNHTMVIVGMPVRETHGERYYNALGVLGGKQRGPDSIYLKRHLVPFGEYLPFKSLLDPVLGLLRIPMSNFSAGDQERPLISVGRDLVGVFICFEIAFPNEVREAMPGAAYLVNISNDAWFGDSLAPAQHLQMARMRALESGRYLLRATNTGITAIIDPEGSVQQVLPQFKAGALTGEIRPAIGGTVYTSLGDTPLLVVIAVMLTGLCWLAKREKK